MGRKSGSKYKKISNQARNIIKKCSAIGTPKIKGDGKIHSISTIKQYSKTCDYFVKWLRSVGLIKNIKSIDDAKKYVPDYLKSLQDNGKSAFTIRTRGQGLAKLYNCKSTDFNFTYEKRERKNITRGRNGIKERFQKPKYHNLTNFLSMTGLRRNELINLREKDLFEHNGKLFINLDGSSTKHGKPRTQEVLAYTSTDKKFVYDFLKERCENNENKFGKVSDALNVHWFRSEYARNLYDKIARDPFEIPKEDRIQTIKDRQQVFDKPAIEYISKQLGHNRTDVIINNYLYPK